MAKSDLSYSGVELRKLPPRFRHQLSQILDINNSWKTLMCSIPSEKNPTIPKYTNEHIELIERYGRIHSKLCSEILLDEWSTSGQIRPTVETLYELLKGCQLYRAADYVATEILDIPIPVRPVIGPAALVPTIEEQEVARGNDESTKLIIDLANCNVNEPEDSNLKSLLDKLNNYDYTSATGNPIEFNIELIETLTQSFNEKFRIGSGAFGTVYILDLKSSHGPKFAVKLLHPSASVMEDQFITEIRVLSKYRHQNLVPLIGFCTRGRQYCLIYEFMSNGSLLEAIEKKDPSLDWNRRLKIAEGIIQGIHYLHSALDKPLIHRDIKSANILLSDEFIPKIGDFGLAKSFTNSNITGTSALASTIFGTSAYMAPEAFRGDISPKMDVFSFGVIILEILTGLPPFDESRTEGNDIVTYLEEIVQDDDGILPFLDPAAGIVQDSGIISTLYSIGLKCLGEKKRRPTSDLVLNELEVLNQRFANQS